MTDRPLVLDRMRTQLVGGVARHRVRRARRVVAGAAAALMLLVGGTVAIIASTDDDSPRGVVTNPGDTTMVPAPATTVAPATTLAEPTITGTAPVGQSPYHVTTGAGSVWVLAKADGDLQRVDPRSMAVETIRLPGFVFGGNRVAVGTDRAWVAGGQVLYYVDLATNAVDWYFMDGGGVLAVDVGPDAVWIIQRGALNRLDPKTGAIETTVEFDQPNAMDVAVTDDAVWVLGQLSGTSWLARVDPTTGAVTARTDIPDFAVRVVADERGVVVGSTEKAAGETYGTVMLVDPRSGQITASARTPTRPEGLGLVDDHIWVNGSGTASPPPDAGVVVLDRRTLERETTVATGGFTLTAGEGAIWTVRGADPPTLTRIDPGPFG